MVDPRNHITFKTPLFNLWSTMYHLHQSCKKSLGCDIGCTQNSLIMFCDWVWCLTTIILGVHKHKHAKEWLTPNFWCYGLVNISVCVESILERTWDQYNKDSKARASTFYERNFEDESSLWCLILCIIGFSVLEIIGFWSQWNETTKQGVCKLKQPTFDVILQILVICVQMWWLICVLHVNFFNRNLIL
jgi:hypothetical protein